MLDPRMSVIVSRLQEAKPYGGNVIKTVLRPEYVQQLYQQNRPQFSSEGLRYGTGRTFEVEMQKNGGGKMKRSRHGVRSAPQRLIRL